MPIYTHTFCLALTNGGIGGNELFRGYGLDDLFQAAVEDVLRQVALSPLRRD
jgi:hypothetical protein